MEQIKIIDNDTKAEFNKRKKETKFVAIDVETTGLSPVYNELIEVSAIKYEGAKKVDTFSTLIKPKKQVSDIITKLTGITNKMLKDAPKVEDVMPSLIKFIGDDAIVAHNANFDYSFLQNNSNRSFTKNKVIDTVAISRKMLPNLPNHKLNTVAKCIGIQEDGFHRAEFDCECCAQIYIKYLERFPRCILIKKM